MTIGLATSRASASPGALTDASSSSSSREELQQATPVGKRRRQRKKPCHVAQKVGKFGAEGCEWTGVRVADEFVDQERRASVVQELAELEARVRELRKQAGAPSLDELQVTEGRAFENARLRAAQDAYTLVLANAQGSFSSYTVRSNARAVCSGSWLIVDSDH